MRLLFSQCPAAMFGFVALLFYFQYCVCALPSLDVTAYEYQHKFHQSLKLGACPHREVAVPLANGSVNIEQERCTLFRRGVVRHTPRGLNDSRNVLITTPAKIVQYLGLCGGEVASFLGLLHSGDCVAMEIANQLSFGKKTVIRAFIGYYVNSLDTLDGTNQLVREGMEPYYKNKFYLKNISYGTLEIIFVQLRYRTFKKAAAARNIKLPSNPTMSAYMEKIKTEVGIPKAVTIISLSTASKEKLQIKKEQEWARALRYVQILELQIQSTRARINAGEIKPHLKYQLLPFVMEEGTLMLRISNSDTWEKTSMLEVQLSQTIKTAKKAEKKCRKKQSRLCRRVSILRRKLLSIQSEIHKGRSNWINLTDPGEQRSFVTKYTALVKTYSSVTKSIARDVRRKGRKKRARLSRKRSRLSKYNNVPVGRSRTSFSSSLRHRIRHSKNRKKSRRLRMRRLRNKIKM